MSVFRVTRKDPLNWVIEKFQPAGQTIERGIHVGKETKERWKIVGYYPSMKLAYKSLLDNYIEDPDSKDTKSIINAIEQAELKIEKLFHDHNKSEQSTTN